MKKVLIGILIFIGVIILIIAVFAGIVAFVVSKNNSDRGEYAKVLAGPTADAPKALVVYQPSPSSTGKKIAEKLAAGLNDSGYEVTLSYPGTKLSADVSQYGIIAFGSSVFAGQPSKVLLNYVASVEDFAGKNLLLYSVGSAKEMPEIDLVSAQVKGTESIDKYKFMASDKDYGDKAYELGKSLAGK